MENTNYNCEDCWSKTGYPRDYWLFMFAHTAMQSLISEISWQDRDGNITPKYNLIADMANQQAEALLESLEKAVSVSKTTR